MPDLSVILPAAGSATRFGSPKNKLFHDLAGHKVLLWTLRAFARRSDVKQIVVPTHDRRSIEICVGELMTAEQSKIQICPGGEHRAGSVRAGIEASASDIEWIAVHDAARPLISNELIDRTLEAAVAHGSAAAAMPVHLTIKRATGPLPAKVERTIPRNNLWAMQTPQIARRSDFLKSFAACPIPLDQVTDDVQLLEFSGLPVWLVQGEEKNIKITTQMDLKIAELIVRESKAKD